VLTYNINIVTFVVTEQYATGGGMCFSIFYDKGEKGSVQYIGT